MAQFPLLMNGAEVCTLEDLKRNFDPNALIEYRKRFAAWLKGWDYDEEAVEVKTLDQDLTDEQWLNLVCNIVGITEQEIVTSKKKADKVKALELEKLKLKLNFLSNKFYRKSSNCTTELSREVLSWQRFAPKDTSYK